MFPVFLFLLWACIAIAPLVGCSGSDDDVPYIKLNSAGSDESFPPAIRTDLFKIAGAPMISPIEGFQYYGQMLKYLGEHLQKEVLLVQRKTYHEINELLRSGDVSAGFICSGAYIQDAEGTGIEILAVPHSEGKPYYRAYLITGRESPFENLEALRGRSFAFTDPLSLTGRYYVLSRLKQWQTNPVSFFSRVVYSGAHDNSVRAVAQGQVDAASVDSLIYDYMVRHQAPEVSGTRIVERSEPFGIPPLVVSPHLDKATRAALKRTLLDMGDDPRGGEILNRLEIDGFHVPPKGLYDPVRRLLENLE